MVAIAGSGQSRRSTFASYFRKRPSSDELRLSNLHGNQQQGEREESEHQKKRHHLFVARELRCHVSLLDGASRYGAGHPSPR